MDFSNLQANLENLEQNTEQALEKKQQTENREASIQDAITQLGDDVRLTQLAQANLEQAEHQRQSVEQELESYRSRVSELQSELQEMVEQNRDSASVLAQLQELGEDVSEGLSLLEQRQMLIDKCTEQLQEILERLGMSGASLEAGGGKTLEGAAESGGATPMEQGDGSSFGTQNFRDQLKVETPPLNDCCGVLTFGNLPAGYTDVIQSRLDIGNNDVRELYNLLAPMLIVQDSEQPTNITAHYRPVNTFDKRRGIYLNAQADMTNRLGAGSTFFHEVGHMIDHAATGFTGRLSEDPEFTTALYSDTLQLVDQLASMPSSSRENFNRWLRSDVGGSCSDLLDGITDGKLRGSWVHTTPNYWKSPGKVPREAFAHFYEASMGGGAKLEFIKSVFPTAFQKFESIVANAPGMPSSGPRLILEKKLPYSSGHKTR